MGLPLLSTFISFVTRGWESHWHRLEGGPGGGRAGHGAAILGHQVPLPSIFDHAHLLLGQVYLVGGQKEEERVVPNIVRLDFCKQEIVSHLAPAYHVQ